VVRGLLAALLSAGGLLCLGAGPEAVRLPQDPLITLDSSKSLGDNINGPSVIRVPAWIRNPMGRYYLYFAHHKGDHIRLAYADSLSGPWKIYEPGVLNVKDTEFYRPQPDPPRSPESLYTHVASPEIYVDDEHQQLVMYVHGMYTEGKRWPDDPAEALKWMRANKFAQFTQTTVSKDGVHFEVRPGITARTSYERLFRWHGTYYSMGRLGVLGRTDDLLKTFEPGPNPFAGGPYAGRVRHVGLVPRGDTLYVFFSAIGDAPESILLSTIALGGDWQSWKASAVQAVIAPREAYDCVDLPAVPSKAGESEGREHALRDPDLIEDNGRVILFYSYCGEQGLAAADVTTFVPATGQSR
jgi:hypothetical protein